MKNFARAKLISFTLNRIDGVSPLVRTVLPYMDITFLISGELQYLYNDKTVVLHSGDAIVFPQGSVRQRLAGKKPVHYASINIRFNENFSSLISGHIKDAVKPSTVLQLETIREAWNLPSEYSSKICLSMISALYYQLVSSVADGQNPSITLIKRYILNNIKEKLSLKDIASFVHWSNEYCSTQFKKHTGKTVTDFINEQKVSLAKRMIIEGNMSLQEISAELGFAEYSYFFRVFKKITGHSPGHYKIK